MVEEGAAPDKERERNIFTTEAHRRVMEEESVGV